MVEFASERTTETVEAEKKFKKINVFSSRPLIWRFKNMKLMLQFSKIKWNYPAYSCNGCLTSFRENRAKMAYFTYLYEWSNIRLGLSCSVQIDFKSPSKTCQLIDSRIWDKFKTCTLTCNTTKKKIHSIIEVNKVKPCFHNRKKSREGKFTIHAKWNEKQTL